MNKKILSIIIGVIIVVALSVGYLAWLRNIAVKTYTNSFLGYSLTYPATWVQHTSPWSEPQGSILEIPDQTADRVILGPRTLEFDCQVLPPTPAAPIDIKVEEGDLDEVRAFYGQQCCGTDYREEEVMFGGKTAYLYASKRGPEGLCPDGGFQAFRIFVVEHKGKVLSLHTDLYQDTDVKKVIDSMRFQE